MPRAARDIEERTRRFAVRTLRVVRSLPRDVPGLTLSRQLARSGTSIGANVEEAQGAHTRREFIRKMNVARAEAMETRYWLRLIVDAGLLPAARLDSLVAESDELIRILTSIVKRARQKQNGSE
jgi:four helix bundle protein